MTHTVQIRGITTDTNLTLEGSEAPITALTWSPDGERLASGSVDGKASIWNPDTGSLLRQFEAAEAEINSITWSPDGRILATGGSDGFENQGNQTVRLWNASTGSLIREMVLPFAHEALSIAWSPNGDLLASGDSFGDLQIWDTENGVRKINLTEHTRAITGVSWSGDGLRLATSSEDGTVIIWGIQE
jgi:dipeptidyl aminopeptidase/acylaminoacyl peptidase